MKKITEYNREQHNHESTDEIPVENALTRSIGELASSPLDCFCYGGCLALRFGNRYPQLQGDCIYTMDHLNL